MQCQHWIDWDAVSALETGMQCQHWIDRDAVSALETGMQCQHWRPGCAVSSRTDESSGIGMFVSLYRVARKKLYVFQHTISLEPFKIK